MIANRKEIERKAAEATATTIASLNHAFGDLKADYRAAENTRFLKGPRGINTQGSGADYHYRNQHDFYFMMERFRALGRDDQIVSQGLRTLETNVIQEGFRLKPRTPDDAINDNLSERWKRWSEDRSAVDFEREKDFHDMEYRVFGETVLSGDVGLNPLFDGSLQHFEAHRIRNQNRFNTRGNNWIVHGIEKNKSNVRVRYHVTRNDYDGINRHTFSPSDVQIMTARRFDPVTEQQEESFFHIYNPRRLSQTRGVSCLAPASTTAAMHDSLQFAKMVQQQVASYFAIIRELPEDAEVADDDETSVEEQNPCWDEERSVVPIAPGAEHTGLPGEKLSGFSPNIPNAEFFQQANMLLTFVSVNLDCPLMLLLLDGSQTNFSGWRGAMNQAIMRFRRLQRWFADSFHSRVYRWKVRQWMAQDPELRAAHDVLGPAFFDHDWHLPKWPYIQPLEDVTADLIEVRNVLNSPRRVMLRKGLEWDTIIDETVADNGYSIEKAMLEADRINELEVAKKNEWSIGWQEVLTRPLAEGFQMPLQPNMGNQEQQPQQVGIPND